MSEVTFWFDDPITWDTVQLGGNTLPGIASVKVSHGKKLDKKKPSGQDGATITDRGYNPADIQITLRIWTKEQLKVMPKILEQLEPPPGQLAKAFDIIHPKTQLRNIKSVIIEEITGPDEAGIKGVYEFQIKCVQFFPPPKKNVTNTNDKTEQSFSNALNPVGPPAPPSKEITPT